MKNFRISNKFIIDFIFPKREIRSGFAVEAELPISVVTQVNERKRRVDLVGKHQSFGFHVAPDQGILEEKSELVVSDLPDKRGILAESRQGRQDVRGSPAGIALEQNVPLIRYAVRREIDQQLADRHYMVHGIPPSVVVRERAKAAKYPKIPRPRSLLPRIPRSCDVPDRDKY